MRSALLIFAVLAFTVYGQLVVKARVAIHTSAARGKMRNALIAGISVAKGEFVLIGDSDTTLC